MELPELLNNTLGALADVPGQSVSTMLWALGWDAAMLEKVSGVRTVEDADPIPITKFL